MDRQELLHKLAQIEEHAKDGLKEFPQLAKERLRMIVALAKYLRSEESSAPSEAALRSDLDDDEAASSG